MTIICDFNLVVIGDNISLSSYIAECERILLKHGLKTNIHAMGTNIEGDWDTVFSAIKECHEHLHNQLGVNRVFTNLKISSRIDKYQDIDEKISAVKKYLNKMD